eukprot:1381429-Pyramimonas_sp.AAC.1
MAGLDSGRTVNTVQPIPIPSGVAWAPLADLPPRWGYRSSLLGFERCIPNRGGTATSLLGVGGLGRFLFHPLLHIRGG